MYHCDYVSRPVDREHHRLDAGGGSSFLSRFTAIDPTRGRLMDLELPPRNNGNTVQQGSRKRSVAAERPGE